MPKLLKTPFAVDAAEGFRTDIQESTGAAPNSATYQVGFPPVTMQSIASNGMPPKGSDLNGVLYDITDNLVFLTQGGGYGFDAAYATSIGGYPLNARLRLTNGDIVKSTIDANANNPNTDMTGWVKTNSASQIIDASGNTQQEINNANAIGYVNLALYTTPLFADVAPIINTLHNQLSEGDTLYIPNGDWNVDSEISITKQINFICDGNLIFSNKTNAKLAFTNPDKETLPGTALAALPKRGDVKLNFTTAPELPYLLNQYHVILDSSEIEINRIGYADDYYKKEPNDIITQDGYLRSEINLDYTDASKLTIELYKKRRKINVKVRGVVDLGVASAKPNVVQFVGWNNSINDIQIDRIGSVSAGTSVSFARSCLMAFRDSWVSGANVAGESSYAFSNYISGFIFLDNCGYQDGEGTAERERGYSGRHGNCVVFNSCKFTGLDDHYGWNYFVSDMDFVTRPIMFAGGRLTLTNCRALGDMELLQLRSDTPFANGTLTMNNCEGAQLLRSIRTIELNEVTKRKMWDTIIINGGTVDSKASPLSAIFARSFMPQDIKEQTTLIINDLTFTHRHKSNLNAIIEGGTGATDGSPLYTVFRKITFNNVSFIDATDLSATTDDTKAAALVNLRANEIELNNCNGMGWLNTSFDKLTVNGGSVGGTAHTRLGSASTGKMKFSSMEFKPGNYIMSNTGGVGIYLSDCEVGADILNLSSIRGYIQNAIGCVFTTAAARANATFDIWNYRKDATNFKTVVAPAVTTLAVGAVSPVFTTAGLSKATLGDQVQGVILNVDAQGCRVNAWVSAAGATSYYIENPPNNPAGSANLTGLNVRLEVRTV